jgi:microcystin-dependent protein
MTLSLPNEIEALTPADAVEVEHNNTTMVDYINTELIGRDGLVGMTAPLKLLNADPVNDDHAARKGYVDALLPVGTMMMYGSLNAPSGRWKLCDGSSLQVAAYPKLFAVLQYSYGGSGGTFALPDLRHRVPIGVDTADTRFSTIGKVGGTFDAALPEHTHPVDHNHASFATGNQSADHTHPMNHDHGGFNTTAHGAHAHQGHYLNVKNPTDGAAYSAFVTSSSTFSGRANLQGGDPVDGEHATFVDVPAFSGSTAKQSANHTHPADVPAFVGPSGKTGTAAAQSIPPFATVAYIIRTD